METIIRAGRRLGAAAQVLLLSWSAGISAPAPAPLDPTPVPSEPEAARTVRFSGYDWKVKSSVGTFGPGPNFFSGSPKNVWVDTRGRLHLKITHRNRQFQCAEIICTKNLGYGTYRFTCDTPADKIDQNAILGMFTWDDEPAFDHREIDVEISKWGKRDNQNAQFVVQPYTAPQHIFRFNAPDAQPPVTYSFDWTLSQVSFQADHAAGTPTTDAIPEQIFTQGIPEAGGENVHINLWLFRGQPPANGKGCEVVIERFEFTPPPH